MSLYLNTVLLKYKESALLMNRMNININEFIYVLGITLTVQLRLCSKTCYCCKGCCAGRGCSSWSCVNNACYCDCGGYTRG